MVIKSKRRSLNKCHLLTSFHIPIFGQVEMKNGTMIPGCLVRDHLGIVGHVAWLDLEGNEITGQIQRMHRQRPTPEERALIESNICKPYPYDIHHQVKTEEAGNESGTLEGSGPDL